MASNKTSRPVSALLTIPALAGSRRSPLAYNSASAFSTQVIRNRPVIADSRKRPLRYSYVSDSANRLDTGSYITLVEIDWDAGTEYYSFESIRGQSTYYEDLVTGISTINREVALLGGAMSASTVTVKLYNRDRVFSIKWATVPIKGRVLRVKYVNIADGLSSAIILFSGRITDYSLSNIEFSLKAIDTKYEEIFMNTVGQSIPVIDGTHFDTLISGSATVLVPVVLGYIGISDSIVLSFPALGTATGDSVAYLVETTDAPGTVFSYVTGAQPQGVSGVNTGAKLESFYNYGLNYEYGNLSLVSSVVTRTTKVYNGHTYAVATFPSEQRDVIRPNEMEITGYVNGLLDGDGVTQIFNPVRAIEFLLESYTSIAASDFDSGLQDIAKAAATSQGYDVLGINFWDGAEFYISALRMAITDLNLKWQDVIERLCESFGMQLYTTREGKLAVFILNPNADPAPDLTVTDENDILLNSMVITSNPTTTSILQYKHDYRYTAGQRGDPAGTGQLFLKNPEYVIPGERTQLGNFDTRTPVNLWYHGSEIRGVDVARAYADYYRSGSQLIEFDLPIQFFRKVELNRYIGITHWQGVSSTGGYDNVTARIYGIETIVTPTSAHIHVKCFKRPAFTRVVDSFNRANSTSLGNGWMKSESIDNTIQIKTNLLKLNIPSSNARAIAMRTEPFNANQLARMESVTTSNDHTIGGIFVRGSGTYDNFTGYALLLSPALHSGRPFIVRFFAEDISHLGTTLVSSSLVAASSWSLTDKYELRIETIDDDIVRLSLYSYSEISRQCGLLLSYDDDISFFRINSGAPGVICLSDALGFSFPRNQIWCEFDAQDF